MKFLPSVIKKLVTQCGLPALGLLLACGESNSPSSDPAGDPKPTSQQQPVADGTIGLQFPDSYTFGMLYRRRIGSTLEADWQAFAPATGLIYAPEDYDLRLALGLTATFDLAVLRGLAPGAIKELDFGGLADDDTLKALASLSGIERIDLRATQVSDAGFIWIAPMTSLTDLNLLGTGIGDAALEKIAKLDRLTRLDLRFTAISDTGISYLANHSNIERLYVSQTSISDLSLVFIATLENLQYLDLRDTAITRAGLASITRGLPGCAIFSNVTAQNF